MPSLNSPTYALALHDLATRDDETSAKNVLEALAYVIERNDPFVTRSINNTDAWIGDYPARMFSAKIGDDLITVVDQTLAPENTDTVAIAASWRLLARHMINPALGFSGVSNEEIQLIASGFQKVAYASDLTKAYIIACCTQDPGLPPLDLLLRFPSEDTGLQVKIWTSNPFGVSTMFDADYQPGVTEISNTLTPISPVAKRIDLSISDGQAQVTISRLEMRHENLTGSSVVEAMKTLRHPELNGLSLQLAVKYDEEDEDHNF